MSTKGRAAADARNELFSVGKLVNLASELASPRCHLNRQIQRQAIEIARTI